MKNDKSGILRGGLNVENEKYVRYGVSDWEFMFEDGTSIELDTIQSQSFVYDCTGGFVIKLVDALIDINLIEQNRKGVQLSSVMEAYKRWNKAFDTCKTYSETYENCSIDKIEVKCSIESVSLCDILIIVR